MSFLFRKKKQEPKSNPDALTIAVLGQHGVDLKRSREVRHYLYFPGEESANAAAGELRGDSLTVDVRPGAQGPDWLLLVTHTIVVDEATIGALRSRFENLARSHGGEYDGWEAAAAD